MTPKQLVEKHYACFRIGDMEAFAALYHDDITVVMNGMHILSGTHQGLDAWLRLLPMTADRYQNFTVTPVNMIAEGDQVFTQIHASADGLDANFGHFHKIVDGKIKEFWIYDDSQKMAHAMKAV